MKVNNEKINISSSEIILFKENEDIKTNEFLLVILNTFVLFRLFNTYIEMVQLSSVRGCSNMILRQSHLRTGGERV